MTDRPPRSIAHPALEEAARAAALFDRPPTRLARRGARPSLHVVRSGDTLSSIARRLGTDIRTLARLNDMKVNDPLRAGQKLVVSTRPAGKPARHAFRDEYAGGTRCVSVGQQWRVAYRV